MNETVLTYLLYLAFTIPLTVWVARALYRHGEVFLHDVFHGDDELARAVNRLLVIGFYLLNLGYVAYFLRADEVPNTVGLIETLSAKVGGVALVLGVVHLANVWLFNAFRKRAARDAAGVAPLAPDARVMVAPAGYYPPPPPTGYGPVAGPVPPR